MFHVWSRLDSIFLRNNISRVLDSIFLEIIFPRWGISGRLSGLTGKKTNQQAGALAELGKKVGLSITKLSSSVGYLHLLFAW